MWTTLLVTIGLVVAGLGGMIYVGRQRLDRKNKAVVDGLLAATEAPSYRAVRTRDLDDLPAPIRRYLRHVLPLDQPPVQAVRLEQTGTFRSGGSGAPWKDFTATQHVTIRPPGFVWDASIAMLPGLSVRVLDAYADGKGALWARLGGVVPVADPTPGPALDEGELMRYLAEAPLYPTALLPDMGITWTAVDDRSARATLEHRGTTATLVFHVNDQDEVERVTGKRPFLTDDGTYEERSWKGTWRNYERRGSLRVPTEGEVAWIHPEGAVAYWRGHMESIEYQFVNHDDLDAQRMPDSP
jgi:hypothetical protein